MSEEDDAAMLSHREKQTFVDPEVTETSISRGGSKRKGRGGRRCGASLIIPSVLLAGVVALGLAVGLGVGLARSSSSGSSLPRDPEQRAIALLTEYPIIDGHNDLPYQIRNIFENQLSEIDLLKNTSGQYGNIWQTDIPRLRAGHLGGQFWSAYMPCTEPYIEDATRIFLDQIDVIKRFVEQYSLTFSFATSSQDIEAAFKSNRVASLIGVESGHAISSSLGTLRQFYDLGARYMTLTHTCNTPWAHSSTDVNATTGLNEFGRRVVREMNRLGMLVDISHVNNYTMRDTLDTSLAPVIFSHSSAYALCDNPRNVPDNILQRMPDNGGIVMVNFYPGFVNCSNTASLEQVADHIDHIKLVAGVDHVGIGSDYDGIPTTPKGLEDVSKYPALFAELIRRGYSDNDVVKIARLNLIRVFQDAEKVSQELRATETADNTLISPQPNTTCRPDF